MLVGWDMELRIRISGRPRDARTAVVLLHGYLCLSPRAYWGAFLPLRSRLAACGMDLVLGRTPRTGNVVTRARRLASHLAALPHEKLILVGHSMGGLDARLVASRLDPERRIRKVVTIGTPHRGSPAAEWVLRRGPWPAALLRAIDRGALRDLTREGASRLERLMPDREDVYYLALGGAFPTARLASPFAEFAERVAEGEPGPNDGLVPLRSALRWQGAMTLEAHHLGLIGLPLRQGVSWPGSRATCCTTPIARVLIDRIAPRALTGAIGVGQCVARDPGQLTP